MTDGHEHVPGQPHGSEAHSHHGQYLLVFYALCVLTALSVIADLAGGGKGRIVLALIVLTIACFKAMFVMMYFMHLKFEGKWKFALLAPTGVLAIALMVALGPDIGMHYYDQQVPQVTEEVQQLLHDSHGEAGHAAGGHGEAAAEH
jgi:cytochrome c oxidase subunit 4